MIRRLNDRDTITMAAFTRDPWEHLRRYTSARIALGRSGGSLPTSELLTFQMHHARAIDAVYTEMDRPAIMLALRNEGLAPISVDTQVDSRPEYLQRPDRGRLLCPDAESALSQQAKDTGVVIAIVDGLSGMAVNRHAVPVAIGLVRALEKRGLSVGPVPVVRYGRVALQDAIGIALRAQVVVSLIGERPGLGTPDSMGAYLVFHPRPGNTDANRNCVSNIRPEGLDYPAAIDALEWLITEALARRISGVALKDDRQLNVDALATHPNRSISR